MALPSNATVITSFEVIPDSRKVVAVFEVNDDFAVKNGVGTEEYFESVMETKLKNTGITFQNARLLDDDDPEDFEAISAIESII